MVERIPAWDNPTWVLAVMYYPDDLVFLNQIARNQELKARRAHEHELQGEADRSGKAAGNVLAILYALESASWDLCAPSLAIAIHCAERLELAERAREAANRQRAEASRARRRT